MAEEFTVARPYAEAVFKLALETDALPTWSETLQWMARVAGDPDMEQVIANPNLTRADLERVFLDVSGDGLNEDARNLVRVLIENQRLSLLPEIQGAFEELREEHAGIVEARICSAFPMDQRQVEELVGYLENRFRRKIVPRLEVDSELIGGATVAVGDVVIDASVRGQLASMASALKH